MTDINVADFTNFPEELQINVDIGAVKQERMEEGTAEDDNSMDALDILALASCTTQLHEENIELSTTEVVHNPFTDKMYCFHCLLDIEKDQVTNHMVHEHGYRKVLYKCDICFCTFDFKPELIYHKQTCKAEPKKKKRYTFPQILKDIEHIIDPGDLDTLTSCPVCMLELTKSALKDHVLQIHCNPQSILNCGVCGRAFKSKVTLRDHIRLVHDVGDSEVPCEICGQIFRSKKYLSNHRRNVHPKGDKVYNCIHCQKNFKSHLCLHQHIKYVHPPESAMAECPQCPKVFKSKINLHQHIRITHLGVRKKK